MLEIASIAFGVVLVIGFYALIGAAIIRFKGWNHRPTPKISQEEAFHDGAPTETIDAMHRKLCDELKQVRPGS